MMLELFIALNMGFIKKINFTNKDSENVTNCRI